MAEAEPAPSHETDPMKVKAELMSRNSLKISHLMNNSNQSYFTLREARTIVFFFKNASAIKARNQGHGTGRKGREVSHLAKESPLLLLKLF
jgi:hypothetical protein